KSMIGSLLEQCRDPWSSSLIDTDGDCRPCCWAGISYGNLSDGRSFGSVWNGDVAREVRRMFLANELPEGCRGRHCRVDV
ncbi:MAG: SPASM domain-containing protein, partial [Candidatus Sumerlaeales bacterium]|nr:SPASM domain-containing protein [Candidatus Sumerlaeales bacterium]